MQLPLEVCHKFGQFAFQDEQKGIEAIAAIEDFMKEYQEGSVSGNDSQAKVSVIKRNQAGIIVVAKTQKLLPNLVFNIKDIATDSARLLDKSIDAVTNPAKTMPTHYAKISA